MGVGGIVGGCTCHLHSHLHCWGANAGESIVTCNVTYRLARVLAPRWRLALADDPWAIAITECGVRSRREGPLKRVDTTSGAAGGGSGRLQKLAQVHQAPAPALARDASCSSCLAMACR